MKPSELTAKLQSFRRRLKLTQEKLAHELGVTVSTVNRWENGASKPSKLAWRAVEQLAQRLGVAL